MIYVAMLLFWCMLVNTAVNVTHWFNVSPAGFNGQRFMVAVGVLPTRKLC